MSSNPLTQQAQIRFVNKLYSLAGPRESLPTMLCMLLQSDENAVREKLSGKVEFTVSEMSLIQDNFKNAVLHSA